MILQQKIILIKKTKNIKLQNKCDLLRIMFQLHENNTTQRNNYSVNI